MCLQVLVAVRTELLLKEVAVAAALCQICSCCMARAEVAS